MPPATEGTDLIILQVFLVRPEEKILEDKA